MKAHPILPVVFATCALWATACATSSSRGPAPRSIVSTSTTPPTPDPRVGLTAGTMDSARANVVEPAAEASWNMRLLSSTPPSGDFVGVTNSDLAFRGSYAIQGNYNGYQVWDVADPREPKLVTSYLCPASQSDVSVYGNLLFVSGEGLSGRVDCGTEGVPDTVSTARLRGIRVFDVTDIKKPRYVANVQTCRGSHTHTVVTDPNDPSNVYIYVSGTAGVRSPNELPGCLDGPVDDPNSARFRLEVIRVPLASPEDAAIVSSPRVFAGLTAPPRHAEPVDPAARGGRGGGGRGGAAGRGGRGGAPPSGPNQCHDITVYPEIGLAGGACAGYGLLLDIGEVTDPKRLSAVADSNFSFWHSATFSNDGSKVLFTDEWGGGSQPRCRATDKYEWGADAIFTRSGDRMDFQGYYKMPAAQTAFENCVAHNGSLIPIPGREVMVQAWYQGGVSVFDWTDPSHPQEIAFFDRGPLVGDALRGGGSWSAYWYNGYIYSSEIARGFDVFELVPSAYLSENEIAAAKTVHFDFMNAQEQRKLVWSPSFALARAYLDQLERSAGLDAARISTARAELASGERLRGQERRNALQRLGTALEGDATRARDGAKVRALAEAVRSLAGA